jgi:hypothetical protein
MKYALEVRRLIMPARSRSKPGEMVHMVSGSCTADDDLNIHLIVSTVRPRVDLHVLEAPSEPGIATLLRIEIFAPKLSRCLLDYPLDVFAFRTT